MEKSSCLCRTHSLLLTVHCLLLLGLSMTPDPARAATGYALDHEAILYVEPGDSYLKLFGTDWLGVYRANEPVAFFDRKGKLTATPEKLVTGMKLIVPAGTQLTEFTRERLARYESAKREALEAIREAEGLAERAPRRASELFRQGTGLLDEARKMADRLTFGFANYLEARRLAREATKCFRIDSELYRATAGIEVLKGQFAEHRSFAERRQEALNRQQGKPPERGAKEWREVFDRRHLAFAGLVAVVLWSLLWHVVRRKRRAARDREWLNGHRRRLGRLLKAQV